MRRRLVIGGIIVAVVLLFVLPVTAVVADERDTAVTGSCGPLWTQLGSAATELRNPQAISDTEIGFDLEPRTVRRACSNTAYRRLVIGAVFLAVIAVPARRWSRPSQVERPYR